MSGQDTPAGDGRAIASGLAEDATPAGAGGSMTPAGVRGGAPPAPSGTVLDPAAVTGPPWPRLVAPGGYTPPRLIAHDYNVLLGTFTPHP